MLKTKYLLPLILILFLTFTLIGNCWVAGYDQRVKLTIDHTKIDETLSNFPVTAFFTDSQAEEIFAEFDADEDFDRGQFALGDDTLLKAEKELFDDSESLGIYHYKVPSTDPDADTDIYFYYDNDADHNTSYIGIIDSATAAEVWDDGGSNHFKGVWHGVDNTTSTVLDSTSNNNDGTKKGANEPIEAVGKVGQGQDFDGTDDYIGCGSSATLQTNSVTVSACIKPSGWASSPIIAQAGEADGQTGYLLMINTDGKLLWLVRKSDDSGWIFVLTADNAFDAETWYHIAGVYTSGKGEFYINGVKQTATSAGTGNVYYGTANFTIANNVANRYFDGIIDEVSMSATDRTAAWLKATHNSLWDTLLTYGSEETEEAPTTNVMFLFGDF